MEPLIIRGYDVPLIMKIHDVPIIRKVYDVPLIMGDGIASLSWKDVEYS